MVKKINDVLLEGKTILRNVGIDEREARLVLAFSLNISIEKLIIKKECTQKEYERYIKLITQRASGIPYAYIVGYKEFMKLNFKVNKNVLIPREDTEILVLEAIKQNKKKILDMCTGSGCIAISLAKNIEKSDVYAVDISARALKIADFNAKSNNVNVKFLKSNLFEKVEGKFDMIVSNPPYIKTDDLKSLQIEVQHEPLKALDGKEDGLYFYRKIIKKARDFLFEGGVLIFEIGFDEAEPVVNLLKENGYRDVEVVKDLSNKDRVVKAKYII